MLACLLACRGGLTWANSGRRFRLRSSSRLPLASSSTVRHQAQTAPTARHLRAPRGRACAGGRAAQPALEEGCPMHAPVAFGAGALVRLVQRLINQLSAGIRTHASFLKFPRHTMPPRQQVWPAGSSERRRHCQRRCNFNSSKPRVTCMLYTLTVHAMGERRRRAATLLVAQRTSPALQSLPRQPSVAPLHPASLLKASGCLETDVNWRRC